MIKGAIPKFSETCVYCWTTTGYPSRGDLSLTTLPLFLSGPSLLFLCDEAFEILDVRCWPLIPTRLGIAKKLRTASDKIHTVLRS